MSLTRRTLVYYTGHIIILCSLIWRNFPSKTWLKSVIATSAPDSTQSAAAPPPPAQASTTDRSAATAGRTLYEFARAQWRHTHVSIVIILLLLLLLLSYSVTARDGSGHPVCAQVSARRTLPGASGPVRNARHRSSGDQRRHTAGSFRIEPMRRPGADLRAVKGAHSRADDKRWSRRREKKLCFGLVAGSSSSAIVYYTRRNFVTSYCNMIWKDYEYLVVKCNIYA